MRFQQPSAWPWPVFPLGELNMTLQARLAVQAAGTDWRALVAGFQGGRWPDPDDAAKNERALIEGTLILCRYMLHTGVEIVIATLADRSETWVLLRSEVSEKG